MKGREGFCGMSSLCFNLVEYSELEKLNHRPNDIPSNTFETCLSQQIGGQLPFLNIRC